jgi:hypothetical protein
LGHQRSGQAVDLDVRPLRHGAEHHERLVIGALLLEHQHALGLFDDRATLERALQLVDHRLETGHLVLNRRSGRLADPPLLGDRANVSACASKGGDELARPALGSRGPLPELVGQHREIGHDALLPRSVRLGIEEQDGADDVAVART